MWEPFGILPANSTAYWKPPPTERGTLEILSTCVITLFLSIWTCLHPSVPKPKPKWYQKHSVKKVFLAFYGLLAPEIVVPDAFLERIWCKHLDSFMKDQLNRLLLPQAASGPEQSIDVENGNEPEPISNTPITAEDESGIELVRINNNPVPGNLVANNPITAEDEPGVEPSVRVNNSGGSHVTAVVPHTIQPATVSGRRKYPWTRTHSYFAFMGGFVIEADDSQVNFFPDARTRLTLTPRALRKLAVVEPMLVPDVSEDVIKDKSKADRVAKSIACFQACWFVVQVLGRGVTSLPISLLELNTLAHALCCMGIYIAYWHKPLDTKEPIVIRMDTERTRKIFAWMIMNSRHGAHRRLKSAPASARKAWLFHNKDWKRPDSAKDYTFQQPGDPSKLRLQETINGFVLLGQQGVDYNYDDDDCDYITLDAATLECLRLADLLRTEDGADDIWEFPYRQTLEYESGGMVSTHMSTTIKIADSRANSDDTQDTTPQSISFVLIALSVGIYGLIHLLAWNGPFPSSVQCWMWRASCLVLASTGIMNATQAAVKLGDPESRHVNKWVHYVSTPVRFPIRKMFPRRSKRSRAFTKIVILVEILVVLTARIYIIVGCFLNLSQLPPEVYQVPQWSKYIPHIGAG